MIYQLPKLLQFSFILLVLIFTKTDRFSQNLPTIKQSDLELNEEMAKELNNKWNRQSVENSLQIYLENAEKWALLGNKSRQIDCLIKAGQISITLGNKLFAEQSYKKALMLSNNNNDLLIETIKVYSELTLLTFDLGKTQESEKYYEKSLLLVQKTSDPATNAIVQFSTAEIQYFTRNKKKALQSYRRAVEFWKQTDDLAGQAKSLLYLGYLYIGENDFVTGLEILDSALAIFKKLDDLRGQTFTIRAMGNAYSNMGEKQKALELYKRAESMFPDRLDTTEKGTLFNSIGAIYENYSEWGTSLSYRQKAFEIFKSESYPYGQPATSIDC